MRKETQRARKKKEVVKGGLKLKKNKYKYRTTSIIKQKGAVSEMKHKNM